MAKVSGVPRKRRAPVKGVNAQLDALREQGRQQSKALSWTDALASWRRLAEIEPDDFESWYRQAQSLFFLGQIDSAVQLARHAWSLAPNDERPGVILARALHRTQVWAEAAQCWQRLLALNPKNFEAALRLSQSLAALGHFSVARTAAEYALLIKPGDAEALKVLERVPGERGGDDLSGMTESLAMLLSQAREYSKNRLWPEAQEAWYQYTTRAPKDFEGYYRLAQALYAQGQHAQAIAVSRRAAEFDRGNVRNQMLLGRLLLEAKDWAGAEACWWAVLARTPDDFEAAYRLGHALFEQGRLIEAKKWLDLADRQRPNHESVIMLLARLRLRKQNDLKGIQRSSASQLPAPPNVAGDHSTAKPLSSPPDAAARTKLLDEGRELSRQKRWEEAQETWHRYTELFGDEFEGFYRLAQAQQELGHRAAAIKASRRAAELDRDDLRNQVLLGRMLLEVMDWEAAEACWWAVLSRTPDDFEAQYRLGNALFEQGELEDARKWLERAQKLQPNHEGLTTLLSRLRLREQSGKKDSNVRKGSSAAASPARVQKQLEQARELTRQKRWAEAQDAWEAYAALAPNEFEGHYRLAQAHQEQGHKVAAIAASRRAVELDRDDLRNQVLLGRLLIDAADWDGAESCWWMVLSRTPDDFEAQYQLGHALLEQGQLEDARKWLERAQKQQPTHAGLTTLMSRLRLRAQIGAKAPRDWKGAASPVGGGGAPSATSPEHLQKQLEDARELTRQKRWAEAQDAWSSCAAVAPDSFEAHYRLAQAHQEQGHQSAAIAASRRAAQIDRDELRNQVLLGRLLLQAMDWEAAEACWWAVLSRTPDDFEAQYRLGNSLFEQGKTEDARKWLERARKQQPTHEGLTTLLSRLRLREVAAKPARAGKSAQTVGSQDGNLRQQLLEARELTRQKRWAEAQQAWNAYVVLRSEDFEGFYRLAQACHELGQIAPAISASRRAVDLNRDDLRNQALLGRLLLQASDWAGAESCWWAVLSRTPDDFEAQYRLGHALFEQGELEDAHKWLERAQKQQAGHAGVSTLLNRMKLRAESARKAPSAKPIDAARAFVGVRQRLAQAQELTRNKRWAEAQDAWEQYVALAPDDFEGYYRLAQAHREQGHQAQAIAASRRAAEINREDLGNQALLGRLLIEAMDWTAAEACWWSVLAGKPDDFEALFRLGGALFEQGKLADARKWLDRAKKIRPAHDGLTTLLSRLKLREGAAKRQTTTGRATPVGLKAATRKSPALLLSDARELTRRKRWADAQDAWEAYTAVSPDAFEGHFRLAQAHREQGHQVQAIAASRRAAELDREDLGNQVMLGRLLIEAMDWEGAEACWWSVLSRKPDDFEASYKLGHALFEQGKLADAKKWLSRAQKQRTNHAEVSMLLRRLQLRQKAPARIAGDAGVEAAPATEGLAGQGQEVPVVRGKGSRTKVPEVATSGDARVLQLMEQGALVEARTEVVRLLDTRPEDEGLLVLQGRIRRRLADAVEKGGVAPLVTDTVGVATSKAGAVTSAQPLSAAQLLEDARELTRRKRWIEAQEAWEGYTELAHEDFEGYYRLAQAHREQGHQAQAIAASRRAAELNREDPGNQVMLGRLLIEAMDWEGAEACWWSVLSRKPDDFEASYKLGHALFEQGKLEDATKWLERALKQRANHTEVSMLLRRLQLRAKRSAQPGAVASGGSTTSAVSMAEPDSSAEVVLPGSADSMGLAPTNPKAASAVVEALMEQGALIEARAEASRLLGIWPDQEGLLVLQSRIRRRLAEIVDRSPSSGASGEASSAQVDSALAGAAPASEVGKAHANEAPLTLEAGTDLVQSLLDEGNLVDANLEVGRFLISWPDNYDLLVLQSRIRRRLDSQVETKPVAKKARLVDASIQDGRDAMSRHDWHGAIEIWSGVVTRDPKYFEGWYRLAQAHFELGRLQDVIGYSDKAREIQPKHLSNLTVLARAHQRLGSTEASVSCWQTMLELSPDNYEATYRLGQCLETLKKPEEAERQFAAAQALKPDAINALLYRVGALVKLGRFDGAIACWQEFIDRRPKDIFARKRYAAFLRTHKRNADAEVVLRDVLQQKPNDLEAAFLLATILIDAQRWKATIELIEPLVTSARDDSAALTSGMLQYFARALDGVGRLADAEVQYREALKHEPESITTLTRLGRVLRELGRPEEAVEIRWRACEVAPQDPGNWQELIFLLASLERETEAREALSLAETALPDSPTNLARLGRICESALFFDDARRYFHRAIEQDPSMAKHAGLFCARQGALDDALRYLNQARDVEPSSVDTAKALISQLEMCEMFGVSQDWILGQSHDRELLLPELLYESMAEGLLDRGQLYEPVRGRVILITGSLAAGGAERQLVTTVRGLVKRVPDVESVTLLVASLSKRYKKDFYLSHISDLPVQILAQDVPEQLPASRKIIDVNSRLIEAFPDDQREAIRVYYQEFVARRPEVVHAWQDSTCLNAIVAAALAGVPRILLSTRSTRPDNPRRRLKRYMQRGYIASLRLPNVVMLNNSQAGADDYEDWLNLPAGSVKVIYNGLDFDVLLHAADKAETKKYRDRYKIPKNAPVIGGVFRMSEEKRPLLWVETAAEIAREIPSAHFVVAGDGPMRFDMQERAQELGIADRLHMPGHVSVPSWFLLMDVVLLTSRMEGLPNVLLEAQSFGIPVIAPDVGGCAETIDQGVTGWAVKDATASTLAEKIVFMLKDKAWYEKASVAAANHARQKFSVDAMVGKTLEIYGVGPGGKWPGLPVAHTPSIDALRSAALDADGGDPEHAKQLWLRLLEQSPDDTDANFNLARIYFAEVNHSQAADHLKWLLAVERSHIEGWRWLARSQAGLKEYDDALTSWRKLLTLAPDDFEALYRTGEILLKQKGSALACQLLTKAHEINPSHQAVTRQLARLYQGQGQIVLALEYWMQLVGQLPADFEAHFRAGQLSLQLDQSDDGKRLLIRACEIVPTNFKPLNLLVRSLIRDGVLQESQRLLLWYIRMNPKSDEAIGLLGQILSITGRDRTMQRILSRSARLAASDPASQLIHARWLASWGNAEQAEKDLLALGKKHKRFLSEATALGFNFAVKRGDFESARKLACGDASEDQVVPLRDYDAFLTVAGPALQGESVRETFLRALSSRIQADVTPHYQPSSPSVMHVVNSVASGGTERQSAVTTVAQSAAEDRFGEVTLVRADPSQSGRAAFYLPYLQQHGARTVTLAELASIASLQQITEPLLCIPAGMVAERLGIAEIVRIYQAILLTRPAVVHAWTPQLMVHAAIAGLLAGVPRIVLRAGSVAPASRPCITPDDAQQAHWFRQVLRVVLRDPRVRLVNNSQANLEDWIRWIGLSSNQFGSVPQMVHNLLSVGALGEPDAKRVAGLRKALGIKPTSKVIGAVMRLEPEKGLDMWLDCAAKLRERNKALKFVVIGSGRMVQAFNRSIASRGLEDCVAVVGAVQDGIADYYALMDVMMLSSVAEGLPNAVLEAQWFGVPVVSTDVGGVREAIVDGGGGVTPAKADDISRKVAEQLKGPKPELKALRAKLAARFGHVAYLNALEASYR